MKVKRAAARQQNELQPQDSINHINGLTATARA